MKTHQAPFRFNRTLVAITAMAMCAAAFADEDEVQQLTKPESTISVGVGVSNANPAGRSLLGQYNGLRKDDSTLQVDLDIIRRDDANGTAATLKANNLGLDSRDIAATYERQGDWRVGATYSEVTHREIRTINTGLQGIGTDTPTVVRLATPGSGTDQDLSLKRVGMGLTFEKVLSSRLNFEFSMKTEDKDGARTNGRGYACAAYVCNSTQTATNQTWALLMLPEPVNSTTQQIEARLSYHLNGLNVNAGYYGSFYTNDFGSYKATVPNTLNNPLGVASTLSPAVAASVIAGGGTSLQNVLQLPFALPPDNQAHQFYVSGNYRFVPGTVATFKYAFTHGTQNESFAGAGLTGAPAGVSSLEGVVDNTLVQLGLVSRLAPKWSVSANVKYENKDDKTPDVLYNMEGGTSTPATVPPNTNRYWYNYHVSTNKLAGKLETSYQLEDTTKAIFAVDYNSLDRDVPISITEEEVAGLGALRAKLQETNYRLELRKSMGETFNGSVAYIKGKRTGSDWTSLSTSAAFVAAGLGYGKTAPADRFIALSAGNAFPMSMVDLDREKVKLLGNWTPTEQIDVQLALERSRDTSTMPFNAVALAKGFQGTGTDLASVDVSYAASETLKFNTYFSQGSQNLRVNHSTGYLANLNSRNESLGFGFSSHPTSKLELGANFTAIRDATNYGLVASTGTTGTLPNITATAPSAANLAQAAIGLPDVTYQSSVLTAYAKYDLDKRRAVKFTVAHQHASLNEYAWSNNGTYFTYSDNTTVKLQADQVVTFVAATYIYRFR